MAAPKARMFSFVFALLLLLSASSTAFLIGRTTTLDREVGKEQLHQVSDQAVGMARFFSEGAKIVKRVLLR